jgi:hypothetical protein
MKNIKKFNKHSTVKNKFRGGVEKKKALIKGDLDSLPLLAKAYNVAFDKLRQQQIDKLRQQQSDKLRQQQIDKLR